jgi:hypothetical protein
MEKFTQLLGGFGSLRDFSPENMPKLIEAAKQKAKDERLLPCIPMSFISPMITMAQLFAQRQEFDRRVQNNELHHLRQTFIGAEVCYSSTPLSSLKPSKTYIMKCL